MLADAMSERIIGDKAHGSDTLGEELAAQSIELMAPHRSNRTKPVTQDGRCLRHVKRRWKVAWTISWIKSCRRLVMRWVKPGQPCQGFLHMACIVLLLSEVLEWVHGYFQGL